MRRNQVSYVGRGGRVLPLCPWACTLRLAAPASPIASLLHQKEQTPAHEIVEKEKDIPGLIRP